MIEEGHPQWEQLKGIWESEGKPAVALLGSQMFLALTPDGDDKVKFLPQSEEGMYATTSTSSLVKAKAPGGKGPAKAKK